MSIMQGAGPPISILKSSLTGDDTSATEASRIIAQLSSKWRVIDAPPDWFPQWVLQRRARRPNAKSDGWEGHSYCTSRAALQRCVKEYCEPVNPDALTAIDALPEKHSSRQRARP